jgi:hypothetical protein
MRTRIFVVALIGICIGVTSAYGQAGGEFGRGRNASLDPCSGGRGTGTIETTASPRRLEDLIQISEVILVGTVVNVLPARLASTPIT